MKLLAVSLLLLAVSTAPVGTGAEAGAPPPAAPQEEPPGEEEEFVPSERIRADSAVSFPVDI